MSQRVYLIPVRTDLVNDFIELVQANPSSEEAIWQRIIAQAEPHQRAIGASRRHISYLSKKICEQRDEDSQYYQTTAMQPYFISALDSEEACAITQMILQAKDEATLDAIFQKQGQTFGQAYQPSETEAKEEHDPWQPIRESIGQLREMRRCYRKGISYRAQVAEKMTTEDEPVQMWSMDHSTAEDIPAVKIPGWYGNLLGATFGRLAGLCEPTWWMGNNIWFAQMCKGRYVFYPGLKNLFRLNRMRKRLWQCGASPAPLFSRAPLPGFECGFDVSCPGYSTGLYLPPENIDELVHLIDNEKEWFFKLASITTGYHPKALLPQYYVIRAALLWAKQQQCGLMEGDELVGMWGMR